MIGNVKTKLIIVCDEKTKTYANFLRQLVSANDDSDGNVVGVADGTVDAAVWDESEYLHNAATISSNEHVLFVGVNKTSKSETPTMGARFDRFGMKYGWLGKRGMLQVENRPLNKEEYSEFLEYCLALKEKYHLDGAENESTEGDPGKKCDGSKKANAGAIAALGAAAFMLSPIGAVAGLAALGLSKTFSNKKAKDQQYRVLTIVFYLEGLSEFLEG